MIRKLTPNQQMVFQFILDFRNKEDQLPTFQAICDKFNLKNKKSAYQYYQALEDKGIIERNCLGRYKLSDTVMRRFTNY